MLWYQAFVVPQQVQKNSSFFNIDLKMYWTFLKSNLSTKLCFIDFRGCYEIIFSLPHGTMRVSHIPHIFSIIFFVSYYIFILSQCLLCIFRNYMSSRRLSRPWSTRFHPQHLITSRCGRRLRPLTAMSVRGCYGALPGRACAAQSVALNATRSARTCSMQIVYKVRK